MPSERTTSHITINETLNGKRTPQPARPASIKRKSERDTAPTNQPQPPKPQTDLSRPPQLTKTRRHEQRLKP